MSEVRRILPRSGFQSLIDSLSRAGYRVLGPCVRDAAITFDEVALDSDLPIGWTDKQEGGSYRLAKRDDDMVFGFANGPQSAKPFFFVPNRKLFDCDLAEDGTPVFTEHADEPEKIALLGIRPCDLHAIQIQDRIFAGQAATDTDYVRRRRNTLLVVVNCSSPAATCFCGSMGTGPRSESGFDLALTELYSPDRHEFLIEAGSSDGELILDSLETVEVIAKDLEAADKVTANAKASLVKSMPIEDIRGTLFENLNHRMWQAVGERCLSCGNCTMVCPTCFCSTVSEVSDLSGRHAERWQRWDSCFSLDHSYIHGGSIRKSSKARYRQWMTHKLASWHDQFGTSGCTGCGRCITWCPVGIDITEEMAQLK